MKYRASESQPNQCHGGSGEAEHEHSVHMLDMSVAGHWIGYALDDEVTLARICHGRAAQKCEEKTAVRINIESIFGLTLELHVVKDKELRDEQPPNLGRELDAAVFLGYVGGTRKQINHGDQAAVVR